MKRITYRFYAVQLTAKTVKQDATNMHILTLKNLEKERYDTILSNRMDFIRTECTFLDMDNIRNWNNGKTNNNRY